MTEDSEECKTIENYFADLETHVFGFLEGTWEPSMHGWLTPRGLLIRDFLATRTVDELYDICCTDENPFFKGLRKGN